MFVQSKKTNRDGLPLLCAAFPASPWLSIPRQQRHSLIDLCKPLPEEDPDDPDLVVPDDFDINLLQNWDKERKELSAAFTKANSDQFDRVIEAVSVNKPFEEDIVERPNLCNGPKRYYAVEKDKSYALIRLDWNLSDHQLRQAFDRLLTRCPKHLSGRKNKKLAKVGRGLSKDRLNWLGAKATLQASQNLRRSFTRCKIGLSKSRRSTLHACRRTATSGREIRPVLSRFREGGTVSAVQHLRPGRMIKNHPLLQL